MLKTFINIFRVPELRNKVLFTLMMLAIYRIGFHVPIPGVNQKGLEAMAQNQAKGGSAAGRLASYVSLFSGGSLSQSTIFGLGVMPYISASIIFQLLATVVPSLEKLQKEGETGRKKIQEWTRYATVPLCLIQASFWLGTMASSDLGMGERLIQQQFVGSTTFWIMGLTCLTAGCLFLMWIGEQIDEYGLGNGISLIILAGIVSRMPVAIGHLVAQTNLSITPDPNRPIGTGQIVFLIISFCAVVAGSILITQAQRRIPIQQAKHTRGRRVYGGQRQYLPLRVNHGGVMPYTRGRRVYGGQRQYLPLRVNHGGVMPIIFAQSLMLFPGVIFGWLNDWVTPPGATAKGWFASTIQFINDQYQYKFLYVITEMAKK